MARSVAIYSLLAGVAAFAVHCAATVPANPSQPGSRVRSDQISPMTATTMVGKLDMQPSGGPPVGGPGPLPFVCSQNRYEIRLHISRQTLVPKVRVTPKVKHITAGDCIEWIAVDDDAVPPVDALFMKKIHFFNDQSDAAKYGKSTASDYQLTLKEVCYVQGRCITKFYPVSNGTLRYAASVALPSGLEKDSDPEIVVYCDGCSKDEKERRQHDYDQQEP